LRSQLASLCFTWPSLSQLLELKWSLTWSHIPDSLGLDIWQLICSKAPCHSCFSGHCSMDWCICIDAGIFLYALNWTKWIRSSFYADASTFFRTHFYFGFIAYRGAPKASGIRSTVYL
jgi:hypothetical protein